MNCQWCDSTYAVIRKLGDGVRNNTDEHKIIYSMMYRRDLGMLHKKM